MNHLTERDGNRGRGQRRDRGHAGDARPTHDHRPAKPAPDLPVNSALDLLVAPVGTQVRPLPDEYRWVGGPKDDAKVVPANHFFRETVVPGINARYATGAELANLLTKLNTAALQCRTEAHGILTQYQRLYGDCELALLLNSKKHVELVFRCVSDPKLSANLETVPDAPIRAAALAHRRSRLGQAIPLFRPPGCGAFFRKHASDYYSLTKRKAESNFFEYVEALTEAMTMHEAMIRKRDERSERLAWDEDRAFCLNFYGTMNRIGCDFAEEHPLLALSALADLARELIWDKLLPEHFDCPPPPPLFPLDGFKDSMVTISFEAFCDLAIIGPRPRLELPPATPISNKTISALVGLNGRSPVPLTKLHPHQVDQADAWLRAGVAHGLAHWDDILSVLFHFIRPEHLWKQLPATAAAPRLVRAFPSFLWFSRTHVNFVWYRDGIPAAGAAFPILFRKRMKALAKRVDEWHRRRALTTQQRKAKASTSTSASPAQQQPQKQQQKLSQGKGADQQPHRRRRRGGRGRRGQGKGEGAPPTDPQRHRELGCMMILPAPEEYRYVGTGDIESHDLPADELFRDTVLPGINARFTTRKEIVLFLKKLSDSARQLQTEVAGVFRHFARLHGQHGLATLLESRSNIEAVFRAVLDPNSTDYFEALSDPRLQAAVVAHRRSASRKPIFRPAGSDEFYREVADVFCGAIAFTADQVFQSFMMRLTECLAGHFLKTMDPQARNAMLQADTEASSSHAAMDVVELKMFQRATQQIKFDIQKGLVNANGNHHPLQIIAVLPDLVTGYARVGAVPRGLPYPKLIPTVNELGPYAPLSFKSFCGLFLDGPLLIPELPPVLPCPVDAIKTLIGTKDSPPVAIEAIKESDVEQVEAWLRAGVVHGLASWDVVLGVLHHFIKPEHLWKQVSIDGETRSQRSLVDPIMINGKNLQIHSHHSGIRASVRAFMFPPEPMEALVARIDEWRAHRDQGQLALQVESMTLHDSDKASVTPGLE
ncbi:hypothetical protein H9P43_002045 [Blastocladiella emersonii ATCC 22665]|nr:hypothetical protein H9P43_002045 [Blastocladiella emersonii ATCC 22665]